MHLLLFLLLQTGLTPVNPQNGQVTYVPRGGQGAALRTIDGNLNSTSASLNGTTTFSVGLWFKNDQTRTSLLMGSSTGGTVDWALGVFALDKYDRVYADCCDTVAGCNASFTSYGPAVTRTDRPHYAALTYDAAAKTCTVYVDGVAGTPGSPLTNALRDTSTNFWIAGRDTSAAFIGAIDVAWFSGSALTPALADTLYRASTPCSGLAGLGLTHVACWDLDEDTGTRATATGSCGAGCNLTPGGAITPSSTKGLIPTATHRVYP